MTKKEVEVKSQAAPEPLHAREAEVDFAAPAADIYETPDAYVLLLDLPGAVKESISVKLDNRNLIVKASLETIHTEGGTVLHRELERSGYYREFTIGEGIDRNTVDARYEHGVLSIKLFKSEDLKPRTITIH